MDNLHVITWILAAVAGAASIVGSIVALARASEAQGTWSGKWSMAFAALGGFSLFASFVIHWLWGHGPNNVVPLDLASFVGAHPSFIVIAFALVIAELLFVVVRAKIAKNERPRNAS